MKVKTNLRAGLTAKAVTVKVKSSVAKPIVFLYGVVLGSTRCAGY
jgi:hypothetical protein